MPDWGMWDMRMYNKFGNPYFSDRPCPDCGSQLGDHNTNYNAGTGPIGPDGVKTKVFIKYCDEHYHQRARERMYNRHKNHLLNTAPAQEYFDWVDAQKESVVKQRVVSIKSRNTSLYNKIKREYGYICQVKGCNECEVELAHLYPHSKDDSIDNETNALVLCANHHSALDGHRMCIELDLTFSRYDRDDNQIEWGEIICHEWHKIDQKFIKKSQEWFINDTKEQALG